MTELEKKADNVRNLMGELLKAQQHLKECIERADQARDKLSTLREQRAKALDELYEEVLGKELYKKNILFYA